MLHHCGQLRCLSHRYCSGGILFIGRVAVFISGSNNGLLSNKDSTTLVVIRCYGADSVTHMTTIGGFHACM